MAGRVRGKVALVMGAGSVRPDWGNGKAAAVVYAREGAKVVAVDMSLEAAEQTAAISRAEGFECVAMQADVSKAGDVTRVVNDTIQRFGRIDVLHNNVGILKAGGIEETDEQTWDFVMGVNLKSMFLTCKAVLPHMIRQGKGAIVNISSISSRRSFAKTSISYQVTKAGVDRLTKSIAADYAVYGIRCNAITLGFVNSPLPGGNFVGDAGTSNDFRSALVPRGQVGSGFDAAFAALFLASDEAQYITGVLLPVDGGTLLRVG